jgi:Flp pilus assembly protein TadG
MRLDQAKRRARKATRGAAAIEFALILPAFCLMLVGMLDYGWYFYVDLVSTNAVREGARAATTFAGACPNAAATTAGQAAITAYYARVLPRYTPTVTPTCATTASGDPMFTFSLQMDFPRATGSTLVPMPAGTGNNVRVTASSTMRGSQ